MPKWSMADLLNYSDYVAVPDYEKKAYRGAFAKALAATGPLWVPVFAWRLYLWAEGGEVRNSFDPVPGARDAREVEAPEVKVDVSPRLTLD